MGGADSLDSGVESDATRLSIIATVFALILFYRWTPFFCHRCKSISVVIFFFFFEVCYTHTVTDTIRGMSYYMPCIDDMVSLKVDNVPYKATIEDLRVAFEKCGDIGDIYIPRNRITRKTRGFAFVRYAL